MQEKQSKCRENSGNQRKQGTNTISLKENAGKQWENQEKQGTNAMSLYIYEDTTYLYSLKKIIYIY